MVSRRTRKAVIAVGTMMSRILSKKLSDSAAAAAAMTACLLSYSAAQTLQSKPGGSPFDVVGGVAAVIGFLLPNLKVAWSMMMGAEGVAASSTEQSWGQTAGAESSTKGGGWI